jgi:hypothetical protein
MVQASTCEAPQGTSQSNQKNVKLVIGELTSIKPKKNRKVGYWIVNEGKSKIVRREKTHHGAGLDREYRLCQ